MPPRPHPDHKALLAALNALEVQKLQEIEKATRPPAKAYPALTAARRKAAARPPGRAETVAPMAIGSKEDWDTNVTPEVRRYYPDQLHPGFTGPAEVGGESYVTPDEDTSPYLFGGENDEYRLPKTAPPGPTLYEVAPLPRGKRKVYSL